jgi:hypothetical protein
LLLGTRQKENAIAPIQLDFKITDVLGKTEYRILAIFRFTGYWFAIPETVPFGFIASRTLEK